MRRSKRVVIIGGGMMGVGLLYHLAEMGWKDVLLFEKGELTSGSTWHAAGQCASFQGNYNISKIHHYGIKLFPRLQEMTGQYVSWHGCGAIRIATTPEEADWFRYVLGISRNIGYRMELIGPDEIRKLNPFMDTTGVVLGAWTLDDGHVDPAGSCNALAIAAKNLGAAIETHTLVTGIDALPSGEWLVRTDKGEEITAGHVVNAAGCYAREVGRMVGLDVPITNMEHQYLVTEPIEELIKRDVELPVMRDTYTAGYYRQEQKAGLIGIYEHANPREAWDHRGGAPDWSASNELFAADLDRIAPWLERALERMPLFAKAGIKRVINGAIPHTPDGMPLLGPAAGLRNFWMCCGSSIGIAQGPGCGKHLAEWMIAGESEINMKDFDPRRFGGWADETYTRAKSFEDYAHMFVTHLPGEERPAGRPVRRTPLYDTLQARGCVFTEGGGYERPKFFTLEGREEVPGFRRNNVFAVVAAECLAVRERVGVADMSSFAKYDVTGPDAGTFLDRLLANRLPRRDGGLCLTHLLTANGRIETEFTVTRLAADRYYLLSSISAEVRDLDHLNSMKRADERVTIENVTDKFGVLVVAGPKSREVLSKLTEAKLDNAAFRWLTAQEIDVSGIRLRALRVNYVGELGWELHAPMEKLPALYDRVRAAGEPHGIADFGLYAMNSLRMEKAYRGWGAELTNEITLVEADMDRFVAPDKGSFRGRDATLKRQGAELATKLVYLEIAATDNDARGGEPILANGRCVGVLTSGGYGHAIRKSLAFGYVEPALSTPGTAFEVELLGERVPAKVLGEPAYDPASQRPRA
ncbi:MAG: FAD-dependent oxidoreductase [Hyphomicrobiaceae bacterium]